MDKNMYDVSIVIPVYNAIKYVQRLFPNIVNTIENNIKYEVIIVDDNSDYSTQEFIKKQLSEPQYINWQYLKNSRQQLFTRTVNRGILACEPDTKYIAVLNTDINLKYGWLSFILNFMNKNISVGLCGYIDSNEENEKIVYKIKPDYVTGHCILIRKSVIDEIGLLEEYDIGGIKSKAPECPLGQAHIASDRIYCYKLNENAYQTVEIHSNKVIHDGNGASWNRNLNWLYKFNVNQLWQRKQ